MATSSTASFSLLFIEGEVVVVRVGGHFIFVLDAAQKVLALLKQVLESIGQHEVDVVGLTEGGVFPTGLVPRFFVLIYQLLHVFELSAPLFLLLLHD